MTQITHLCLKISVSIIANDVGGVLHGSVLN
jgi:hypothetical protein